MTKPSYCIDASALLNLRHFRREVFEGVWSNIEDLIVQGRLIAPIQVRAELVDKGNDIIEQWVKTQQQMFIEIDEAQGKFITGMYATYPHLKTQATNRLNAVRADPFIIAVASIRQCSVVTAEGKKEWGIPDICQRYGIACLNLDEMMINEGWKFQ